MLSCCSLSALAASTACRSEPQSEWCSVWRASVRVRGSLVLGFFLELACRLLVLLADLVELLHVLKEVGTSLEGDEQFGFLAVVPLVVTSGARRLNCDGLGSDLLECSVIVSTRRTLASARDAIRFQARHPAAREAS